MNKPYTVDQFRYYSKMDNGRPDCRCYMLTHAAQMMTAAQVNYICQPVKKTRAATAIKRRDSK